MTRPQFQSAFVLALAAMVLFDGGPRVWPGGPALLAGQPRDQRINLAVLRADGILLPFASFDGNWKSSWPDSLRDIELPASVSAVPRDWWGGAEPGHWRVIASEQGAPGSVKLIAPVMFRVGTAVRLGIRTDLPPARLNVRPFEVAFPKVGLAVAGDVEVEPIPSRNRADPASHQFVQSIRSALNSAEERTVVQLRLNTGWKHPYDKKTMEGTESAIEAWYSTPIVGSPARASYIEVVKKYPPQPKDEGCGLETFITGWIIESTQDRPRAELRASVVYCDREKASYMLPLGQMTVRNRTYWVFQMSGQDHEWYAVAEITRSRARVEAEYFVGGLPAPFR